MKLENSVESVKAAKKLLGMPEDARIGLQRVVDGDGADYAPILDWQGVRYLVGDEIPDLVGAGKVST